MKHKTKILAAIILLISTTYGGFYLGQATTAQQFEQRINDPKHAIGVVLANQNSWRPQFHATETSTMPGRGGAWVTMFKPRFTGAITYVVFSDTNANQTYILQTLQHRVVDGKELIVGEPPAGFFNSEYIGPPEHVITEDAERNIEMNFNSKQQISHSAVYADALNKYNAGQLTRDKYSEDTDLWQTAVREVAEESGLDISKLESDPDYKVSRRLFGEIETPYAYVSIRLVEIVGTSLPKLQQLIGDEVISAEWVSSKNFDLINKTVTTSTGTYPIKPFVLSSTESLVKELP